MGYGQNLIFIFISYAFLHGIDYCTCYTTQDPCLTTSQMTSSSSTTPSTTTPPSSDGTLVGMRQPQGLKLWDSTGTCSGAEVSYWRPFLPGSDWRMVGMVAEDNLNELPSDPIWIFREYNIPDGGNPQLVPALTWTFVWDSRAHPVTVPPASIWRATCPPGYGALGDVVCMETHELEACEDAKQNFTCVRYDLLDPCSYTSESLFQCEAPGEPPEEEGYDISVWPIMPISNPEEYALEFFMTDRVLSSPPPQMPLCIRRDSFLDITYTVQAMVNFYMGDDVMVLK